MNDVNGFLHGRQSQPFGHPHDGAGACGQTKPISSPSPTLMENCLGEEDPQVHPDGMNDAFGNPCSPHRYILDHRNEFCFPD